MTDFETVKYLLASGQIDEAFEQFGQKVFVEVETPPETESSIFSDCG